MKATSTVFLSLFSLAVMNVISCGTTSSTSESASIAEPPIKEETLVSTSPKLYFVQGKNHQKNAILAVAELKDGENTRYYSHRFVDIGMKYILEEEDRLESASGGLGQNLRTYSLDNGSKRVQITLPPGGSFLTGLIVGTLNNDDNEIILERGVQAIYKVDVETYDGGINYNNPELQLLWNHKDYGG